MSTHANPDTAYVWLDGDGWRAPAGTAAPADPFALTGVVTSAQAWSPFGGIEAGFEINPTRDFKELPVWNRRASAYKTVKGPKSQRAKMRCVDNSPATVLTMLQGGAIVEVSPGVNRWDVGDDEEFALLLQLRDGDARKSYHSPRVTLVNDPATNAGGEVIDGYDFELLALEPFVPYTNNNPLDTDPVVPQIGSRIPPSGTFATAGGNLLVLLGSSFTGTTTVTVGGTAATDFEIVSDSVLSINTPAKTAGTHNVVVTNATGASANFPIVYA